MSEPFKSMRRENAIRLTLFLLGFIPVAAGVTVFLVPQAHGTARYTFTGSPLVDAILIGLVSGFICGSALVGVRQLLKGDRGG